jgi:predicted membrane metal-binding protein
VIGGALQRARFHCLAAALCAGLASANAARMTSRLVALAGLGFVLFAIAARAPGVRLASVALALALGGLWWGSIRLAALDRSPLLREVDRAERARVDVTGPARRGRFSLRVPARVLRFGLLRLREPVLLELPLGRSPPQGARLEVLGEIELPRTAMNGFDERAYLRRHGVHVVLRGDRWRMVGRRGGFGSLADRLRDRLDRALASGTRGEHRKLLQAVVLGADGGLPEQLRDRFRASGLYHLLGD